MSAARTPFTAVTAIAEANAATSMFRVVIMMGRLLSMRTAPGLIRRAMRQWPRSHSEPTRWEEQLYAADQQQTEVRHTPPETVLGRWQQRAYSYPSRLPGQGHGPHRQSFRPPRPCRLGSFLPGSSGES